MAKQVSVKVINNDVSRALKSFKRKVNESGHLNELRERQEYLKPSTVKRINKQKAKRLNKLRLNDENPDI